MRITNVSTAVIEGNFPWVLVKIETDAGVTGLGEAYWGVGVAELENDTGRVEHAAAVPPNAAAIIPHQPKRLRPP